MSTKAKIQEGHELRPYGANSLITQEDLTDEIAVMLLESGRVLPESFKTLPEGYKPKTEAKPATSVKKKTVKKVVAKPKSTAPKADETKVEEKQNEPKN